MKRKRAAKTTALAMALVILTGLFSSVLLVRGSSADITDPAQLGTLDHYNGFIFNTLEGRQADIEGALAVGNVAKLATRTGFSYDLGAAAGSKYIKIGNYKNPDNYPSFLLNGTLTVGRNNQGGQNSVEIYGGPFVLNEKMKNTYEAGDQIRQKPKYSEEAMTDKFFADAKTTVERTMRAISYADGGSVAAGTVVGWGGNANAYKQGGSYNWLHPTNLDIPANDENATASDVAVINITSGKILNIDVLYIYKDLIDQHKLVVFNFPDAESVTFNGNSIYLKDSNVVMDPSSPQGTASNALLAQVAPKVVYSFPAATDIYVKNAGVIGSVLAPGALVEGLGGSINGMLVADSMKATEGFELHGFKIKNWVFDSGNEDDQVEGSVTLTKTEVGTSYNLLEGAVFKLYLKDSGGTYQEFEQHDEENEKKEYITDRYGHLAITGLPEGDYKLVEHKAPDGFVKTDEEYTFTINLATPDHVFEKGEIENTRMYLDAQLTKQDAETGAALTDAEFTLYKSHMTERGTLNMEIIDTMKTGASGTARLPKLAMGFYYLLETKVPDEYEHEQSNVYQLQVRYDEQADNLALDVYHLDIDVDRYDLNNLNELENTQVEKTALAVEETNNNFVITNRKAEAPTGAMQLFKTDTSGNLPLQGARFKLEKEDENTPGTWHYFASYTTNAFGLLVAEDLPVGRYLLTETKAPDGYALPSPAREEIFTISATNVPGDPLEGPLVELTYTNEALTTDLSFKKVDAVTGDPVEDAEFYLYRSTQQNGKLLFNLVQNGGGYTFTSDAAGKLALPGLLPGFYYLVEARAADGYELPQNTAWQIHVELETENGAQKATVTNVHKLTLYDGFDWDATELENTDEGITRERLDHENELIIENTASTGRLVLHKSGTDGTLVEGAEFTLYTKGASGDFDQVYGIYTTNSFGVVEIEDLRYGEYQLDETRPAPGYETSADGQLPYTFVIGEGNAANEKLFHELNVTNALQTIDVSLTKQEAGADGQPNGIPVPGAEFTLYRSDRDADGFHLTQVGGAYSTDGGGVLTFPGLTQGHYYFAETKAPDGYIPSDAAYQIYVYPGAAGTLEYQLREVVDYDESAGTGTLRPVANNTITNQASPTGSIVLQKWGEDGSLSGAVFELWKKDDAPQGTEPFGAPLLPAGGMAGAPAQPAGEESTDAEAPDTDRVKAGEEAETEAGGEAGTDTDTTPQADNTDVPAEAENTEADGDNTEAAEPARSEETAPESDKGATAGEIADASEGDEENPMSAEAQSSGDAGEHSENDTNGTPETTGSSDTDGAQENETNSPCPEEAGENRDHGEPEAADGPAPGTSTNSKTSAAGTASETARAVQPLGAPLSPAAADLAGWTLVVADATSNSFGLVLFTELEPGEYLVREVQTPEGYLPPEEQPENEWAFTVDDSEPDKLHYHLPITNEAEPTPVMEYTLTKTDGGQPLGGATFALYRSGRTDTGGLLLLLQQNGITTGAGGEINLRDLEEGFYYLIETATPTGYQALDYLVQIHVAPDENGNLGATAYSIDFDEIYGSQAVTGSGDIADITKNPLPGGEIANLAEIQYGELVVQKYDSVSGSALAGARFALYHALDDRFTYDPNGTPVATAASGQNGIARFGNLPVGQYVLVETSPVPGYDFGADTEWPVVIKATSGTLDALGMTIAVPNDPFTTEITLEKRDAEDKSVLPGAEFNLYKSQKNDDNTLDFHYVGSHTSEADGRFKLENLTVGNYYLVETDAPEGYWLPNTYTVLQIQVTLAEDKQSLSVAVRELDLPNAGDYDLNNLTGIANEAVEWEETLQPENDAYPVYNEKTPLVTGRYILQKTSDNANTGNLGLSGAGFTLYYRANESEPFQYHSRHTSNAFGYVVFDDLIEGYYYAKETTPPAGYELAEGENGERYFEIFGNGQTEVTILDRNPVKNKALRSAVQAYKYGTDSGDALLGTSFELYAWANKPPMSDEATLAAIAPMPVAKAESDENGIVSFGELTHGWYTLRETGATYGYNSKVETVTDENGKLISREDVFSEFYNEIAFEITGDFTGTYEYVYKVYNPLLMGDVAITKNLIEIPEDTTSWVPNPDPLAGVEFALYKNTQVDGMGAYEPFAPEPYDSNLFTTDEPDGTLTIEQLPVGRYRLVETGRPDVSGEGLEYIDEKRVVLFSVQPTEDSRDVQTIDDFVVENYARPVAFAPQASITVHKVNSQDPSEGLGGAWFTLERNGSGGWADYVQDRVYYTNASGALTIAGLEAGDYRLTEIKAPANFALDAGDAPTAYFTVDFDADNQPVITPGGASGGITTSGSGNGFTFTIPNDPAPQVPGLELYKIDGEDYDRDNQYFTPLPGAEFRLYHSLDGHPDRYNFYGTVTSNAVGMITLPQLEEGHYRMVETVAPDGYEMKEGGEEANTYKFEVWQDASGAWYGSYAGQQLSADDDMLFVIMNFPVSTPVDPEPDPDPNPGPDPDPGPAPNPDQNETGDGEGDEGGNNGGAGAVDNDANGNDGNGASGSAIVKTGDDATPRAMLYLLASLAAGSAMALLAAVKIRRGTPHKRKR